jgi:hypothetical protein
MCVDQLDREILVQCNKLTITAELVHKWVDGLLVSWKEISSMNRRVKKRINKNVSQKCT